MKMTVRVDTLIAEILCITRSPRSGRKLYERKATRGEC